jgi:hypothetical protein
MDGDQGETARVREDNRLKTMQAKMLAVINRLAEGATDELAADFFWALDLFGGEQESILDGADESYAPGEEEEEDRDTDVVDPALEQEDVIAHAGQVLAVRRSARQAGREAGQCLTLEQLRLIGAGQ